MIFESYEERREKERKIEADVSYEIWRAGGNPDTVNSDRVQNGIYEGHSAEEIARTELRVQRQARIEWGRGSRICLVKSAVQILARKDRPPGFQVGFVSKILAIRGK